MNDTRLNGGVLPHGVHRLRQTLQPVTHEHEHVDDAAVLQFGEHVQPVFGAFTAGPGPDPQNVSLPIDGDADGHVERLVGDLSVADLDVDRVDEHHRVHRVQWPVGPFGHLLDHFVGDPGDGVLAHRLAVGVGEERTDLTRGESFRRQRQHHRINPGQPALPLTDHKGFERAVPVPGHLDADRAQLGVNRLHPRSVALVGLLGAGLGVPVAVLVAQMFVELGLQGGFQDLLGQRRQRAAGPDQRHPLSPGLLDQLRSYRTRRRLPRICHIGHRVGHENLPSSPGLHPACRARPAHRLSDSPCSQAHRVCVQLRIRDEGASQTVGTTDGFKDLGLTIPLGERQDWADSVMTLIALDPIEFDA